MMRARSNEACEQEAALWAGWTAGMTPAPEQSDDGDLGAGAGSWSPFFFFLSSAFLPAPLSAGGSAIRPQVTAKQPSGGRAKGLG